MFVLCPIKQDLTNTNIESNKKTDINNRLKTLFRYFPQLNEN